MNSRISVIIPMYNAENYIEKTLNLLLSQSVDIYELIIVDDGSTDNSYEICKKFEEGHKNIIVLHTENRGSGPARTTGIENATGEYLYFPDADDELDGQLLEKIQIILKKEAPDLLVFGYRTVYPDCLEEEKKYKSYNVSAENARQDYYKFSCMESEYGIQGAPWNKIFKREVIVKNKIEYPSLRRHQDEAFISRYVDCISGEIIFIPDVLYTYYANDPNLEWVKFPVDYENAVKGLIQNRKETVLKWNLSDERTHLMMAQQLFCRSVKACENLYSPKQLNMSGAQIRCKIAEFINTLYLKECPEKVKMNLGRYHRIVYYLVKKDYIFLLYFLFGLKKQIDQSYVIRKYLRKRFKSSC